MLSSKSILVFYVVFSIINLTGVIFFLSNQNFIVLPFSLLAFVSSFFILCMRLKTCVKLEFNKEHWIEQGNHLDKYIFTIKIYDDKKEVKIPDSKFENSFPGFHDC